MTFINLPHSSFAQTATTTNANQTSEENFADLKPHKYPIT